jgi:hypothetical protein
MKTKRASYLAFTVLVLVILACGSGVQVNTPTEQGGVPPVAEVQATSTAPVGAARSNPAPAGSEVVADDMAFVVTGSTRPATDVVMAGNQFNTRPEAGQEYAIVNVRITCRKSSDDKCSLFSYSLKLLGSSGIQRDPELFVTGVSGLIDFSITEFFGGATLEGGIPFIVNSDETDLLLVYSPLFGNPFYLAIQ